MLTREEDYAHQQPSLTAQKLRRLEVSAGAPTRPGKPTGVWATRERMRQAEKQLAATGRGLLQALGRRLAGSIAQQEGGRERDSGARIIKAPPTGQRHAAGHGQAPDACSLTRHRARAHNTT